MDGRLDAVVVGAGTGGTFTGVARYVKEQSAAIHAVLVEPEGSVFGGSRVVTLLPDSTERYLPRGPAGGAEAIPTRSTLHSRVCHDRIAAAGRRAGA